MKIAQETQALFKQLNQMHRASYKQIWPFNNWMKITTCLEEDQQKFTLSKTKHL